MSWNKHGKAPHGDQGQIHCENRPKCQKYLPLFEGSERPSAWCWPGGAGILASCRVILGLKPMGFTTKYRGVPVSKFPIKSGENGWQSGKNCWKPMDFPWSPILATVSCESSRNQSLLRPSPQWWLVAFSQQIPGQRSATATWTISCPWQPILCALRNSSGVISCLFTSGHKA